MTTMLRVGSLYNVPKNTCQDFTFKHILHVLIVNLFFLKVCYFSFSRNLDYIHV